MEIKDKVVLITGASAGIGRATARVFAEEGAKTALAARSADLLGQLADELRGKGHEAIVIPVDLRDPEQARRAVTETASHYGRIDVLINNAGQAAAGAISDVSLDHFRQIIDLNIFGPLVAMQAVIPIMKRQGDGLIINVSSMVSKMRIPGLAAYAATKSALNMLSDTARVELAPENIRVISIFPRMTATDFGKRSLGNEEMRQRHRAGIHPSVPVDTPEHVAGRILSAAVNEPEEQYMD